MRGVGAGGLRWAEGSLDRKAIEVLRLVQARCLGWEGGRRRCAMKARIAKARCYARISRESFLSSRSRLHYSTSTYETPQFTEIILRHRNDPNAGGFSLLGVVLQYLSLSYTGLRVGIYDEAGGSIGARGGRE
jgi:hypothetical protein